MKIDLTDLNDSYEDYMDEITGLTDENLKKMKNIINVLDNLIWSEINYRAEIRLKKISSPLLQHEAQTDQSSNST